MWCAASRVLYLQHAEILRCSFLLNFMDGGISDGGLQHIEGVVFVFFHPAAYGNGASACSLSSAGAENV